MDTKILVGLTVALLLVVPLQTGCARAASKRAMAAEQQRLSAQSANEWRKLTAAEVREFSDVLTGEIHTVYPSDNVLARVYGQVGNLGDRSYSAVRFDVVARPDSKDGKQVQERVVGTFSVDGGFRPGDVKPFDVQTTASMGDVKDLVVVVSAVR